MEDSEKGINKENERVSDYIQTRKLYETELRRNEALIQENKVLQAVLALYFADSELAVGDDFLITSDTDLEEKYKNLLIDIGAIENETTDFVAQFHMETAKLEAELSKQEEHSQECSEKFFELKREVGRKAVYSGTGKCLNTAKLERYLRKEKEVDGRIRKARFEFLKEKNALKKEEVRKAQLSKAGHSMGLQEYKMTVFDTQVQKNYADKRREELESIKRKCWEVINIITHLKLKLLYLMNNKKVAEQKLATIAEQVNKMTRGMVEMKAEHEATTRRKMKELQKKFALLHDEVLPADYEHLKCEDKELSKELENLKDRYHSLSSEMKHKTK